MDTIEESITPEQKKVLDFVSQSIRDQGLPPTHREIARACGLAGRSSVQYHLKVLREKGLLKKTAARHRGLALAQDPFRVPVLSRVGAGGGILAQEDVLDYVSRDWEPMRRADFFLEVKGDSMAPELLEKDLIAVRRQEVGGLDGDVVVALLGEETVVKRLRRKNSERWFLESANPRYSPITGDFQVVGTVLGSLRRYARR